MLAGPAGPRLTAVLEATGLAPAAMKDHRPPFAAQRARAPGESCQVRAVKVEMLKIDIRMPQQVCLVIEA